MEYQRQQQPGCGGCLLLILLFVFLSTGASGLINFLGWIFFFGIFTVFALFALFWGFSFFLKKRVATYEASQTDSHNRFVWLLVNILIHISKIDGNVSKEEITTIQNFFQYNLRYSQTQMSWVKNLIKEAIGSEQTLDQLLQEFKNTFAYEPRLILLELIYQIIYTKEPVPDNELNIARRIASFLEISAYDQRSIESRFTYKRQRHQADSVNATAKHYATLGLEQGADKDAIKKAYRKLSMQYHPDKVRHLGDEFQTVAEEKMKEINAANEYLNKL